MAFHFFARPHPLLPPAAEYELPDFELRDESQVFCRLKICASSACPKCGRDLHTKVFCERPLKPACRFIPRRSDWVSSGKVAAATT